MITYSDALARILDAQIASPSVKILINLIHENTESNGMKLIQKSANKP